MFPNGLVEDTVFLVVYFQGKGRFFHFQVLCLEESFALRDLFAASFQLTLYLDGLFLVSCISLRFVRALDLQMSRGSMLRYHMQLQECISFLHT